MKEVIFYLLIFLLIYSFYLFFVLLRKKKLEKFKENIYITFLKNVYGIQIEDKSFPKLAHTVALINSFIIATTLFLVGIIPNFLLKMVAAFCILIPFQFFMYFIIGKCYQRKQKKTK